MTKICEMYCLGSDNDYVEPEIVQIEIEGKNVDVEIDSGADLSSQRKFIINFFHIVDLAVQMFV